MLKVYITVFVLTLGSALIVASLLLTSKDAPVTWSWTKTVEWFKSSTSAKAGLACFAIGSAILLSFMALLIG